MSLIPKLPPLNQLFKTGPIQPIVSIQPIVPIVPIQPIVSTQPIVPIVPIQPIVPIVPTQPIVQIIRTQPIIPIIPIQPPVRTQPIVPIITTQPIVPIITTQPIVPIIRTQPIVQIQPLVPVTSMTPSISSFIPRTLVPSVQQTIMPKLQSTLIPSVQPNLIPSVQPSLIPKLQPVLIPSVQPSAQPVIKPFVMPNISSLIPRQVLVPKTLPPFETKAPIISRVIPIIEKSVQIPILPREKLKPVTSVPEIIPSKPTEIKSKKKIPPELVIPNITNVTREIMVEYYNPTEDIKTLQILDQNLIGKLPLDTTYKNVFYKNVPYHKFTVEDTYVTPTDPMKDYVSRQLVKKNVLAWGQRKLGLALIQFLVKYLPENKSGKLSQVIYAGSAPGENIAFVAKIFKNVVFHLYDPRDFKIDINNPAVHIYSSDALINPNHRIILYTGTTHGWFTDSVAKKWAEIQARDNNVFFVSDIRTGNHEIDNAQQFEEKVWQDMLAQSKWHNIIRPIRTQLKFRLPYDLSGSSGTGGASNSSIRRLFPEMKIPYLPGIIYKGIYNKPTSTESRLVPTGYTDVLYDFKEYESKMFYFNSEIKEKRKYLNLLADYSGINPYDPPVPGELLNDYNSMAETFIWIELLKFSGQPVNADNVKKLCDALSKGLSLDYPVTLSSKRKEK